MRVGDEVSVTIRYLAAVLAVLLCSSALAREKTDIVWMSNGDRLTGEIKNLQHGKLLLSTDSLGEINIEWNEIERVQSDYEFQIERTDGMRVTGVIDPMSDKRKISLTSDETTVDLALNNVVRMSQMDDDFWDRLDGSMSFGYSFTKASDVAQGNFSFRVTHRTEIRSFTVGGSTIVTNDQANENTQRSDLNLNLTRYRKNRWFNSFVGGFESNDELGLDMRSSIGAGIGRFLVQTTTSELGLMGGLVASTENLSASGPPSTEDSISSQENLEGLLGLEYSRFIFGDPMVDLTTRLSVFPSITDSGRTRAQFDINFRWELISDLFWDLSYYNTYDSDPPSGSLSTSDYGMVTSIGWSF